jgi:hypothetical protein
VRDWIIVLTAAGFIGCIGFIALYAWRSAGWHRTDTGRNLMSMMGILAVLLGLVLLGRAWGPLPLPIWLVGMALLDTVIWWRVVILWRRQHEGAKQ